jgi:hypothetical protein
MIMTTTNNEYEQLCIVAADVYPACRVQCDPDGGYSIVRDGELVSSRNLCSQGLLGYFEGIAEGVKLGEVALTRQSNYFRSRLPMFAGAFLKDLADGDPSASSLDFIFSNLHMLAWLCSDEDDLGNH